MKIDIGDFIHSVVCGLHAGKNSEQAAGYVAEDYLRLGRPTKALYLAFDLRAHYYPETPEREISNLNEGGASCSLHYLFHRTYGSTGFCTTYTFAAVHDDCFARLKDVRDWQFLSSHNSCWKDAAEDKARRVENELYDRVCAQVGFADDDHIPYNRLSWSVWFPTFQRAPTEFYEWVDVQIDKDPEDRHGYKCLVTVK